MVMAKILPLLAWIAFTQLGQTGASPTESTTETPPDKYTTEAPSIETQACSPQQYSVLVQTPTCRDGLRGRDGRDGVTGRDGKDGEKGDKGDTGMMGPRGQKGEQGPAGASTGGTVYTRWGRTTCPDTLGTELVYSGTVAGSNWNENGGGANYLCLPDDPQPLETTPGVQSVRAKVYGVDYNFQQTTNILSEVNTHNPPCAVCYSSKRETVLMIPAKPTCPSSWTLEYAGYLVSERHDHNSQAVFECMDKDPECIPDSAGRNHPLSGDRRHGAFFQVTEVANCASGIPCPPYSQGMELSCAVCTR